MTRKAEVTVRLPGRQNGTGNEYLHVLEHRLGKQWREAYNKARQFERQCRHQVTYFWQSCHLAYAAFRLLFKDQNG